MKYELIHEATRQTDYSRIEISRTYKVNNQLFRITLSTYNKGSYTIYRFSNTSGWNWLEAEGESFIGRPDLENNTPFVFMAILEEKMSRYAAITEPYKNEELEIK